MKFLLWRVDPLESTRRYSGATEREGAARQWACALAVRDGLLVELTNDAGESLDVITPNAARAALHLEHHP